VCSLQREITSQGASEIERKGAREKERARKKDQEEKSERERQRQKLQRIHTHTHKHTPTHRTPHGLTHTRTYA